MENKFKYIFESSKSKEKSDISKKNKIILSSKSKLLPYSEINKIISQSEQFNKERQESYKYRFTFDVTTIFSNCLMNITGDNSFETFMVNPYFRDRSYPPNTVDFDEEEDITYKEAIEQNLKEVDGWFGYLDPNIGSTDGCKWNDMYPSRNHFEINPTNWDLAITYPDYNKTIDLIDGGIIIIESTQLEIGGKTVYQFATPIKHNLLPGDTVRLKNLLDNSKDGIYTVFKIGNEKNELSDYFFSIEMEGGEISNNSRMVRIFRGEESTYYARMFKKIPIVNGYVDTDKFLINKLSFSKNIFNDVNYHFLLNYDIDLANIRDNLNRPISELYFTFIKKRSNFNDGNGDMFTEIKSGIEAPYIPSMINFPNIIPDIHRIHNGSSPIPHVSLETNVDISNTHFFGDIVEYNRFEVKETVLAEVMHRFNTNNRILGGTITDLTGAESSITVSPRYEGYYYKPHHLIKIREFSNYVEQGDESTYGIPDYAEDLGDGRWLWRDLLDLGISDTSNKPLDYPFINGRHYIHKKICLLLKRQDPNGLYGLYSDEFPSDPRGYVLSDKFKVNKSSEIC
jgi:hypothetical protein